MLLSIKILSYKHLINQVKKHAVYENSKITKTSLSTLVFSFGRQQNIAYDDISMPPWSGYAKEKGCRKLTRIQQQAATWLDKHMQMH